MNAKCQDVKTVKVKDKKYILDTNTGELLEILADKSTTGKERPWRKHKIENLKLVKLYYGLAEREANSKYWLSRGDRLASCGSHLGFNIYEDEAGGKTMKVTHAESCRVRLCPLCSWRRTIKIFTHARKILEKMQEEGKYAYIMVTFTVPNVAAYELDETITRMMEAWNRFQTYSRFKKAVKGWYRGLEVAHNTERYKFKWVRDRKTGKKRKVYIFDDNGNRIPNPSYDTYHPHFHCIFAVNKSYFTSRDYIKQEEWLDMWRRAYRDETITQVDVRRVKSKKGKDPNDIVGAVAETAKYTVKTEDYIIPKNWELSLDSIKTLDKALANRRLVAFGGKMRELHKLLNLDDEIDGDLIEDSEETNGKPSAEVTYFWHVGYQQYILHQD